MVPTVFHIIIYSDTVCPWASKTLEQVITLYQRTYPGGSKDIFHISWLPYCLDSSAPILGILADTRVREKNGADRAEGIKTRLRRVGKAHGIDFTFAGKVGNTRDSHRLTYLAGLKGEDVQMALAKELLRTHFEGDADVTDHIDLVKAGVAAGMEEEEIIECLKSDDGGEAVDRDAQQARESGVNSVPIFEINRERLEGAEDVSAFYEAFSESKGIA